MTVSPTARPADRDGLDDEPAPQHVDEEAAVEVPLQDALAGGPQTVVGRALQRQAGTT